MAIGCDKQFNFATFNITKMYLISLVVYKIIYLPSFVSSVKTYLEVVLNVFQMCRV